MRFKLFESFTSAVDVSDERYIHYQKKRLIPFTRTPFKSDPSRASARSNKDYAPSVTSRPPSLHPGRQNTEDTISTTAWGPDQWDDEPVGERPPGWLELSGDLAWTATFSSLTSNTDITDGRSIISYGVFFGMMWQLWASQASYDIKFYMNDWWHRLFFILQLCTYGGLAAFTSDFDIFWAFDPDGEVFVGDANGLTAQAIAQNRYRKKQLSFMGISLVIAISRSFLLLQYLRVAYYRYRYRVSSWLHMLTPISIAISSTLFFACYGILKSVDQTSTIAIVQFLLWGSAMFIEIIGHAFTPDDSKEKLRGHGSITERLSTLTVIVMGEGLNGLSSTLRHSVNAPGFGTKTVVQIASVAIILYMFWLLYFEGFRKRLPPRKTKKEIWLLLHLPFHLFLILTLEGLKNSLLYNNLLISTSYCLKILIHQNSPTFAADMSKVLQKLDLSWEQQIVDSKNAYAVNAQAGVMQWSRWTLTVMYKMFQATDDNLDPKAQFWYDEYMKDDKYVQQDITSSEFYTTGYGAYWNQIVFEFEKPLFRGTLWVIPVAGVVLLSIGLLNYVQSRPRDRYAWGSFLTKVIAGVGMICLAAFSSSAEPAKSIPWFMPIIAILLAAVVFVDLILLHLLVRSARKQTGSLPPVVSPATGYGSDYHPVGTSDTAPLIREQAPMGRASSMDVSRAGISTYPPTTGHLYSSPTTYGAPQSFPTISSTISNPSQPPAYQMGHSSSAPGYYGPNSGAYDPWDAPR